MIYGRPVTFGNGSGGIGLNIAYGLTPPADTSKLWVPLGKTPDAVEVSGDVLRNDSDTIVTKTATLFGELGLTSAVAINGKAYIFGGNKGNTYYHRIQEYDPATDKIVTKGATLTTGMSDTAVASVNGKAYIFGGVNSGRELMNIIQEYDPATDTITTKSATTDISTATISHCAAVTIKEKIYVFGVHYDSAAASYWCTIQEYDPATDTITTKKNISMSSGSGTSISVVAIRGKVYIFGRFASATTFDAVHEYDPETNTLTQCLGTGDYLYGHSAVAINSKAYIFGVSTRSGSSSTPADFIREYDPVVDKSTVIEVAYSELYASAVAINGKAYIFGGGYYYTDAIHEYTPKTTLATNHLRVLAAIYHTDTAQIATSIVNEERGKIKLAALSVFLGDEEGYAVEQEAYVYNEETQAWQTLDGVAYSAT